LLDIQDNKRYAKAFYMRLHRAFPRAGWIWRLEYVTRKSGVNVGKYYPHYHLLVWGIGIPDVDFRAWVAINWYEVCGSVVAKHLNAGTGVERIRDNKGVFIYASKYLAKVNGDQEGLPGKPGRFWGVVYLENIPFVKAILCELREEEAVKLIRYMRRYARLKSHDYKSLSVFCDVNFWYDNLVKILYNSA